VSVEDLVEGEKDWSTCLSEVEQRSKFPEKEVIKREREINLEGKISLVVQNRQTGNVPLASVGKGMHGTKETARSAQEDVYDVSRSWSVILPLW